MSNARGQRHFRSTSEVCQSQFSTDCQEKVAQSVRMKVNTNNRLITGYLAQGMWVGFSYGCHLQPGGKQQGNSHQHAKDESLTEREMREKCKQLCVLII